MNSLETKQPSTLNGGKTIKCLSIIALVCIALNICITFFSQLDGTFFSISSIFSLLILIFYLILYLLLLLYIFKFHAKRKASVLVPTIFVALAIQALLWTFYYATYYATGISALLNIIAFVACIPAIKSALNGLYKKRPLVVALVACLLFGAKNLIYNLEYSLQLLVDSLPLGGNIEHSIHSLGFGPISAIFPLGSCLFYIALLVFCLKNTIPVIVRPKLDKNATPEQQLQALKAQRENDLITEEEYQVLRAEVISKL